MELMWIIFQQKIDVIHALIILFDMFPQIIFYLAIANGIQKLFSKKNEKKKTKNKKTNSKSHSSKLINK